MPKFQINLIKDEKITNRFFFIGDVCIKSEEGLTLKCYILKTRVNIPPREFGLYLLKLLYTRRDIDYRVGGCHPNYISEK